MAQAVFDALVHARFAPFFRAHGFRKRRYVFWRPCDEVVHVVQLQKSAYNSASRVAFYVNVAVASMRLQSRGGTTPPQWWILEHRLETLAPSGAPHVWDIDASADLIRLADDVEAL